MHATSSCRDSRSSVPGCPLRRERLPLLPDPSLLQAPLEGHSSKMASFCPRDSLQPDGCPLGSLHTPQAMGRPSRPQGAAGTPRCSCLLTLVAWLPENSPNCPCITDAFSANAGYLKKLCFRKPLALNLESSKTFNQIYSFKDTQLKAF